MTAWALAGRLGTTAGILDGGVLEVRLDGTIGYVGPASGWSGPAPEPVDTVAPGYVDIHCHGGGKHTCCSRGPAEGAPVSPPPPSPRTPTMPGPPRRGPPAGPVPPRPAGAPGGGSGAPRLWWP